jgi:hypothetical protein
VTLYAQGIARGGTAADTTAGTTGNYVRAAPTRAPKAAATGSLCSVLSGHMLHSACGTLVRTRSTGAAFIWLSASSPPTAMFMRCPYLQLGALGPHGHTRSSRRLAPNRLYSSSSSAAVGVACAQSSWSEGFGGSVPGGSARSPPVVHGGGVCATLLGSDA